MPSEPSGPSSMPAGRSTAMPVKSLSKRVGASKSYPSISPLMGFVRSVKRIRPRKIRCKTVRACVVDERNNLRHSANRPSMTADGSRGTGRRLAMSTARGPLPRFKFAQLRDKAWRVTAGLYRGHQSRDALLNVLLLACELRLHLRHVIAFREVNHLLDGLGRQRVLFDGQTAPPRSSQRRSCGARSSTCRSRGVGSRCIQVCARASSGPSRRPALPRRARTSPSPRADSAWRSSTGVLTTGHRPYSKMSTPACVSCLMR